jgi:hypothetical protein
VASKSVANVTISRAWTDRAISDDALRPLKNLVLRLKAIPARIIGKSRVYAF